MHIVNESFLYLVLTLLLALNATQNDLSEVRENIGNLVIILLISAINFNVIMILYATVKHVKLVWQKINILKKNPIKVTSTRFLINYFILPREANDNEEIYNEIIELLISKNSTNEK